MSEIRVGIVGVGKMGGAMARRILDTGAKLTVCDRNRNTVATLENAGARVAASAQDLADQCTIVISCLPSPEASVDVAIGEQGVVHGKAVRVLIETSTIGRAAIDVIAKGLEERNIGFLDCPISGGPRRALTGTLALIASGAEAHYAIAKEALALLGECFYLGATPGLGQLAKILNNHVSAAGSVAVFKGLAMGIKAGIDLKLLNDILNAGTARNDTTVHKVPLAVISGTDQYRHPRHRTQGRSTVHRGGGACNAGVRIAPHILALYREAAAAGYKDRDSMRLFQYVQSLGWDEAEARA